jgi:carbon monoxide dehydrogenase subunit G
MNLEYRGEEKIPADHATVWAFVTTPAKVGHCLPDVLEVTAQDPTHFEAVVQVAVGPVRGRFKVKVELISDVARRRIDMKISGGGFGSAVDLTAGADLLDPGDGTTVLKRSGQAVTRGPVAAVGGRALDAQAKKLIEQTFANVRRHLTA